MKNIDEETKIQDTKDNNEIIEDVEQKPDTKKQRKDTQSKKYQITLNNYKEKEYTHERLKYIISQHQSIIYYCLADEIAPQTQTPHIHIFLYAKSPIRFSTMQKMFPQCHIETARGSCVQNRDYILKSGKYANDPKADTSVAGTFEEYGEMPVESGQGSRTDLAVLYEMVKQGMSDYEILECNKDYILNLDKIGKVRQMLKAEEYKDAFRELEITYVYGQTRTGKTRNIMDEHGYSNVHRITDYTHPFDSYKGQDVIVFEEFRSSLTIVEMLNYLDGYPCELRCRYHNKTACYTKVFIISNIKLEEQYPFIQETQPATWQAFLRRIQHIKLYYDVGQYDLYTLADYLNPPNNPTQDSFQEITDESGDLPF